MRGQLAHAGGERRVFGFPVDLGIGQGGEQFGRVVAAEARRSRSNWSCAALGRPSRPPA
jgi:hypothetical protein